MAKSLFPHAGRASAVELLLDHGAAVDARSMDESTPLHKCAAWQASPAIVGLLAAKSADINARVRLPVTADQGHYVVVCMPLAGRSMLLCVSRLWDGLDCWIQIPKTISQ